MVISGSVVAVDCGVASIGMLYQIVCCGLCIEGFVC